MSESNNSSRKILQIEKLVKRFPGVVALKEVSFDVTQGEVHALCGENGAGKSTLIKILSGIHPAGSYEGTIKLIGQPSSFHGIADAEKAGIAVIYQELALVRGMTVAENIFLAAEPRKGVFIDWNKVYAQTQKLLDQYGLHLDPAAVVGDLGIGQQQLVEIVKALSKNSKILLLDEPTAALTESEVEILLRIVRQLKTKGITCIYISHKLDEVFAIADRITVLRDGESVVTLDAKQTNKSEVIRHMVGREIKDLFPRRSSRRGEVLLKIDNLSVGVPGKSKPVLDQISLELHAGEVLGFGGLMGAGRTELLMHLFGVYGQRLSGKIFLHGKELPVRSPTDAIARGLVLVSEDRKRYGLFLEKTIGFNISLAALQQLVHHGLIDHNREIKSNQSYFDALGIRAPGQETMVATLSGGNQQKVVLGKALMTQPAVVFLDEPTRGIDVGAKVEVYEIINKLTEQGKAVVLVSSELLELMGMSDRMLILSNGRIGGSFAREQATQEAILTAAMAFS
ncbi:MAG: sugar ABC transporter ATP-binding protein [bacterium]